MAKKYEINIRKKLICCTAMLLAGLFLIGCRPSEEPEDEDLDQVQAAVENPPVLQPDGTNGDIYEIAAIDDNKFRAVWVATVLNLDFPSSRELTADDMKNEIDAIIARTAEIGMNAIIFQVRPTGDAFYESSIFPWSHWLTGTQGQGIPGFDPLAYWIEKSHENNIELHAWLNPYRIIHTATNSSDPESLAPDNPVRLNPELAVAWSMPNGNSGLFLDPGLPEARQLIIDGIEELAINYDVDGIHIDDYFYPGTDFDDAATFEQYGNGMELDDWRRENVNTLIRDIQSTIKDINQEYDKDIRWGISPSGIWKNDTSDPLGVPVPSTFESYKLLYADTRRWVLEEWVDYICPQIYWYIGFETADFKAIFDWWVDLCKDTDVDLYIGHAAYREDQNDQPPNWNGEMIRQLEMVKNSPVALGSAFYRFYSLRGALGDTIRDYFIEQDDNTEHDLVMVINTLSIGFPDHDVTFTATAANAPGYNVVGASVPGIPLYLNGEEVTNRTREGFFFVYVPLETGVNELTFSQAGQDDVVRKITRNAPGSGGGGGGGETPPAVTITQITTPRYATINSDEAWLFPSNTNSGGSDWMLSRGQRDRVIAESSNNFVKLSCGMWVSRDAVLLSNTAPVGSAALQNGAYRAGTDYDIIAWESSVFTAVHAEYDGTVLRVNFGMQTVVPPLSLPNDLSNTIFSSYDSGIDDGVPYFEFTIREDVNFEGYYVDHSDDELRLHLKKRKTLAPGGQPLDGITIMLDPGHGGEHSGAVGPLGGALPEKYIVLEQSLRLRDRLEALGATVILTRDSDVTVGLQERVNLAWQYKPDLFVSVHINSVAETTNAENIRGFTVWHRNPNAISISETFLDIMFDIIPGSTRTKHINQSNFFVCRPAWMPAVLLENGFIINIDDFVWLIDPVQQSILAGAMTDTILEYFSDQG